MYRIVMILGLVLAKYVGNLDWGEYLGVWESRWPSTWVLDWGPTRRCLLLDHLSCGGMKMVRASGFVWIDILYE